MKGLRNKVWGIEFEGEKKNLIYLETLESELCLILPARFSSGSERHMTIYIFSKSPNYPSLSHTNFNAFLRTKPDHPIYISKKLWHKPFQIQNYIFWTLHIFSYTFSPTHILKIPKQHNSNYSPKHPVKFFFFIWILRECLNTAYCWKLKTFCWKHYKIIFKCVNSAMGPSFKVKFTFSVLASSMNSTWDLAKKRRCQMQRKCVAIQTHAK